MDRRGAGALLTIAVVVACSSPTVTTAPPAPSRPPATPTFGVPSLDIEQPGQTAAAGQIDTEWGPIWLAVPEGFPVVPIGPAEPVKPETGPASGAWVVPLFSVSSPREIADYYGEQFSGVGLGGGLDGPLEDGSYSSWASNGYGCDILVTAKPRGDETLVTALYGAGCPFSWPER